ncbi:MAG: EAL domain-containing protein [Gammaproteobacteria bacterium]|nr:EAL domain-containing protein [Gammaproteobacteria bacterium]
MIQDTGELAKDAGAEQNIKAEQTRLIYRSMPFSLLAILINSSILSLVLWQVIDHSTIIGWLVAVYLTTLYRFLTYRNFLSTTPAQGRIEFWRRLAILGATLSGALWGAASLLLFPLEHVAYQALLVFVIAGMSAGAVTTLSSIFTASATFLLLTLLPLVWRFLFLESDVGYAMTAMGILFMLIVVISSKRLNQSIQESLKVRYERQLAEEKIIYQAHYDELTQLPNRRLFIDRLNQEITRAQRHQHFGAILFLDLDHFKNINDSLGHRVGDKLLQQVAQRLRHRIRNEDTAARLGGDEFVILLTEIGDSREVTSSWVQNFAAQIQLLFTEPFIVQEHELHLSASIGVTLFPINGAVPEDLLQQADVAMYRAKAEGRDQSRFFLPSMQEAVHQRLEIEKGLRRALATGELELYYQLQVDITGTCIGAEALLRWNHPERGLIAPNKFISVAEETGLIYKIGDWVLATACRDMAQIGLHRPINLSVNVSPKQFRETNFVERVQNIINRCRINPSLLRFEITENVLIENFEQTVERMQQLKKCGISFSIDDFGTGHSSLAYLKRLPVEMLKIDRSFVRDISTDPNDAIIVETILDMARHMGLKVVAEGVETQEAFAFLKEKGCEYFQGYLFSHPVPLQDLLGKIESTAA